jgi:hypothetical protein
MKSLFVLPIILIVLVLACRQDEAVVAQAEPFEEVPPKNLRTTPTEPSQKTFVNYVIAKGQHYAQPAYFEEVKTPVLAFTAIFDRSAMYQTKNPVNQFSINKLYGFSDCGVHHQTNSARFGWRWLNGAVRIYTYCYTNGRRIAEVELGQAEIDKPLDYRLEIRRNTYVFTFKGKQTVIVRGCTDAKLLKYKLFPYFGGTEPAPHNITIKLKEL